MVLDQLLHLLPAELMHLSNSFPFSSAAGSHFALMLAFLNIAILVSRLQCANEHRHRCTRPPHALSLLSAILYQW
jgi:hypothetical protein